AVGASRLCPVHGASTDLFLETNLPREDLLAIASSLDLRSRLPRAWGSIRSGRLVIQPVRPAIVLAEAGLTRIGDDLPLGYAPASATRTLDAGNETGITITFRHRDTDAPVHPSQLHPGAADA